MTTNLAQAIIHSSIGTASRSIGARFGDIANVKDFGAIGDGVANDTAAIQAAHNASPAVFYPYGTYLISAPIVLPSNAYVIGQGDYPGYGGGSITLVNKFTMIKTSNNQFAFTHFSPSGKVTVGPKFSDLLILCQNGVQINTPSTGAAEGLAHAVAFRRTSIIQSGVAHTGTGILVCRPVQFSMNDACEVLGFSVNVDVYYNVTPSYIVNTRIWQFAVAGIRLTPNEAAGQAALFVIQGNDMLQADAGALGYVVTDNDETTIRDNFVEHGSAVLAAGGAAFVATSSVATLRILDNEVTLPAAAGPNWLNVTAGDNFRLIAIHNNLFNGSTGPAVFNNGNGLPVFSSAHGELVSCVHSGNNFANSAFGDEVGMPLNSVHSLPLPDGVVSMMTPNLIGAITNNMNFTPFIVDEDLLIPPQSGGLAFIVLTDPFVVKGQITSVKLFAYASAAIASTDFTVEIRDGTSVLQTINQALTPTPTWYTLSTTTYTLLTRLNINLIRGGTTGGTAKIKAIVVRG